MGNFVRSHFSPQVISFQNLFLVWILLRENFCKRNQRYFSLPFNRGELCWLWGAFTQFSVPVLLREEEDANDFDFISIRYDEVPRSSNVLNVARMTWEISIYSQWSEKHNEWYNNLLSRSARVRCSVRREHFTRERRPLHLMKNRFVFAIIFARNAIMLITAMTIHTNACGCSCSIRFQSGRVNEKGILWLCKIIQYIIMLNEWCQR